MTRGGSVPGGAAFRFLYALAFLGAHLGFMPLLLLLLPRRVELLAGDRATTILSLLLIAGAVTASIAHVVAGHWSDRWIARHGQRRTPIAAGLLLLTTSYAALAGASSIASLAGALIAFQVALNIMFAPLGALLTDHVEDQGKARTAALLTLALPLSIALCGPVAAAFPSDGPGGFLLVAGLILACVLPLLMLWPATVRGGTNPDQPLTTHDAVLPKADFRLAWLGRFLVQCGAALIIFYLYVYLRHLPPGAGVPVPASHAMSLLVAAGGMAGALAAIVCGQLSDRLHSRRWPIACSGAVAAVGLLLLAAEPAWYLIVTGYALFSAGLMAFLSTDSAMVAQMLGSHPARGRWLGIMNLTNTLPGIVTPLLTLLALQIASGRAITALLAISAFACLVAAALILRVRSVT